MALSATALAALSVFADQLGDLDAAGLSVAAGVTEAEAAEFIAGHGATPEPVIDAKPPEDEKPKGKKPKSAPEPAPEVEAPGTVIVTHRNVTVQRDGKPFSLSYWGIYGGADAAWLWRNAREHVEPFDIKRHG